jgi:ABC-2 type transport system permease protein
MIFHIAFKDLIVLFKDKKALMVLLLMPALIMLILGTALAGAFTSETAVGKFPLAVVNKDDGQMSLYLINMVFKGEMSKQFDTFIVDENEANEMLKNKTVPSVVIIPKDFSKNIDNLKDVKIEVKSNVDDKLKSGIVESVVQGFSKQLSLVYKSADALKDISQKYNTSPSGGTSVMSQTTMVNELQQKLGSELVRFQEQEQEKARSVSAMQYYSAAMLVMFLLFSAMQAISFMVEERENKTLSRIMGTRATRVKLIAGKCLGLLMIGSVQALILIVFTGLVYGVDWGGQVFGVALVTICTVFACSGLGMFIAAVAKTLKAANGMGSTMIQIMTAVGGGMVPIYVMPDFIKTLANVTPNWQAMDGYYKLMQGLGMNSILPNCSVLVIMGVLFLSIGILKFRTV